VPYEALVRPPGPELARCELTHLARAPIDTERAAEQHAAYAAALESLGVRVRRLTPLAAHPDACFLEDPALVLDDVAVLARPGVLSRRGEVAALAPVLAELRPLERIEGARTLEGGDVLEIDGVLYPGLSARTDHAGMKELAHRVLGWGLRVKAVDVRGALHLKTALTWLGDDVLLANPDWVDLTRMRGFRVLAVDPREPFGANVLKVGRRLVVSAAAPRTNELLVAQGHDVLPVELSEFHKAEAGPTCLSLLYRAPTPSG
jgi:dimethylargininase